MSVFSRFHRRRVRARFLRGRVFLLALLAGLILAWCNGAFGREPASPPRSSPAVREFLTPVNFAESRTIIPPASN